VQQIALATQTALAQTNLNAAQAATATALWLDQDDDRDGLTNRQELKLNTLPNNRDTDQDGIDDGEEINKWGTDPLKADTDGDGIKDGDEISRGINPKLVDTDKDGINDASDPDPGHVPTPTPNLAATAAFVATQTEGARQVAAATMTEAARQTEAAQILTLTAQAPTATPLPADTSVPTIAPTTVPTEAPTPTVPPTANQCLNGLPNPVLVFAGSEDYEANGQQWTRYSLQVDNRGQFPDELFTAAPDLPPCGANSNAARTWVDIFSNDNTRLYGFCALSTANDLDSLWFATQRGATPPASVYMTLQDRRCGTTYTSNPVAIPTLTPQVIHLDDYAPAALIESSELAPDGHNAVAGTVTQLAWMGGEGDGVGFVRLDAVQMEDGSTQNALRMHPKWVPHGSVKMWFKSATVHVTAHAQFMAQVGFLAGAGSPDGVTFWAWEHHQEGGNETWNPIVQATKLPNGSLQAVQADLSGLAGKDVYIELRVDAGESSGQDWAAWIDPRIELSN
jgi:hypothetical protein